MKHFLPPLMIVIFATALSAHGRGPATSQDYYDCYKGFNGFPITKSETHFNSPFFVVPIPQGEEHPGKDTFMILNARGAKELLADRNPLLKKSHFLNKTEINTLSITPAGESTHIEMDFYTHPDHNIQDKFSWIGLENDPDYQKTDLHKSAVARKAGQSERPLSPSEEEIFLQLGAANKLAENEQQLKNGALRNFLDENLKNGNIRAKEAQLRESAISLSACNKFSGNADLQHNVKDQTQLIQAEQDLIDRIKAKTARTGGSSDPSQRMDVAPAK